MLKICRRMTVSLVILVLVLLCFLFAYFNRPRLQGDMYVLMYHDLVESGEDLNDWTITADRFREDLQWLRDNGYTTLLPGELAQAEELPKKSVLITFDDGYASNYRLAFPLLQEFDSKAAIAVIAKRIEDHKEGFLTWEMCREMSQSGLVEIGSHSYDSHHHGEGVARLPDESRKEYKNRVFTDLEKSIELIESNVGHPVTYFAYPHGQTDPWAKAFLKKHFSVTTTSQPGVADVGNGLYMLPRYNISMRHPLSDYLE